MEADSDEADQQVILEEEIDENYEPTHKGSAAAVLPRHRPSSRREGQPLCLTCLQRSWSMPNGWAWTWRQKE
jgi:hypothetical protein